MKVADFSSRLDRRAVLGAAAGAAVAPALSSAASAQTAKMKFAVTSLPWDNLSDAIRDIAAAGYHGIEFFPNNIVGYVDKPLAIKKMLDDAGLQMCSCSNGGPDFSTNFFDRSQTDKTVADHVRFARDFLAPFGYVKAYKANPGGRPGPRGQGGNPTTAGAAAIHTAVTDEHIKIAADTFNRIGEQTIKFGIKIAAHPHCSSVISTAEEIRRFIALTDPRYVWFTLDTGHIQLAGIDPLQLMKDHWDRVAEIHYKDLPPTMRGNRAYAPPMMGPSAGGHGYWRNLGGADSGGVDFPAIHKFLLSKSYDGWISMDLDATMLEGKDLAETAAINARYVRDVLKAPMKPRAT